MIKETTSVEAQKQDFHLAYQRSPLERTESFAQTKAFCIAPWVHVHVDTRSKVTACCNASVTFGSLRKQTLAEIWQGDKIKAFRQKMLRDQPDRRCQMCYDRERAGVSSLRQEMLSRFAHHLPQVSQTDEEGGCISSFPVSWDLRFSNLCNFRCRTCWHGASSRWFEEAAVLHNRAGKQALLVGIADVDAFWEANKDWLLASEELYFAGGEPLLMEQHDRLLTHLREAGHTDVHLRYNTNLSLLRRGGRDILALWSDFPEVSVGVSADASGARGEFLRKGLVWSDFQRNCQALRKRCPHVVLEVTPTVSALNVWHLPTMFREGAEQGLFSAGAVRLNLLHRPDYVHVCVLPSTFKEEVVARWRGYLTWLQTQGEPAETLFHDVEACLEAMLLEDGQEHLPALRKQVILLDDLRGESLSRVFPELAWLL